LRNICCFLTWEDEDIKRVSERLQFLIILSESWTSTKVRDTNSRKPGAFNCQALKNLHDFVERPGLCSDPKIYRVSKDSSVPNCAHVVTLK